MTRLLLAATLIFAAVSARAQLKAREINPTVVIDPTQFEMPDLPIPVEQTPALCVEQIVPAVNEPSYKEATTKMAASPDINSDMYQYAWIWMQGMTSHAEKVERVYQAAEKYQMPPTVLVGAIMQESSFMDMGIAGDFGNWACGNVQINVHDWCEWAQNADPKTQAAIHWPVNKIAAYIKDNSPADICDMVTLDHVKPFFDIAMKRMATRHPGTPSYMLTAYDVVMPARIEYPDVAVDLQAITDAYKALPATNFFVSKDETVAQQIRFHMSRSFAEHCSDHNFGVEAGASTIADIFKTLPDEVQKAQMYAPGEKPTLVCPKQAKQPYYPVAVGWLLADAIYNAGPELLDGVLAYQKANGPAWSDFSSDDLIAAIDYTLALPDTGLSDIGAQEAKNHVRGVIDTITPPDPNDPNP